MDVGAGTGVGVTNTSDVTVGASDGACASVAASPVDSDGRTAFLRAENEDDDGYDPYSDRRPDPEPLFERDPWR
ncbi:hypothetical protein Olsu_0085 [Olsenella uli DSM 7084]|uniref:Uncharacterized protein n=1 Tax=Olsenella uli (strain ATCC 49627 / DSM 7084 / CCUG 31166 / CIP 109912 / JCM 12494 / LMG 11480 / NCIMB 702895 / VPI D76D-27C) TaxID=633147 RepID=E1QXV5_OLSUV|nr:hypothetical protein [Olsenella uli]ADK67219.1 hypothetical protein Olsu_0085 [Olsenella uli DSM 7084]KRO12441.1 hypothetical protein IV77_GL001576 [Olsenella uli DSM 7084]